jgi:hypothetical protein
MDQAMADRPSHLPTSIITMVAFTNAAQIGCFQYRHYLA